MPLDRLVLIIVSVIVAAGATIWAATMLLAGFSVNPVVGLAALSVIALIGYIAVRIIGDRLGNREDDHYDKMDH